MKNKRLKIYLLLRLVEIFLKTKLSLDRSSIQKEKVFLHNVSYSSENDNL